MTVAAVSYPVGEFVHVIARGRDRAEAINAARREVKDEGWRVVDLASAVTQGDDLHWRVEFRVVPRG